MAVLWCRLYERCQRRRIHVNRASGGASAPRRAVVAYYPLYCVCGVWIVVFDTEKCIYIGKLPPLYSVRPKEYGNKQLQVKCWNEVGEGMYEKWNEMTLPEKDIGGKT
ncbi:hypothetical protein PR048_002133 [Dryococelus australis]|uniref:Uncharacterized protein n=1 Tax=Dryococelus australis TaxID=614101 RepID=A0ABQ9IJB2_9NEOP|nr:hypothetical protein PR048_002133 [Dryococelus australis]